MRKILDRRLVLGAFIGAVLVELVAAGAIARLGVAMGVGAPIVLLHAVFKTRDDIVASDLEGSREVDPIGEKEGTDLESGPARSD